jgi:FkbM family methyltransferase
MILRVLRKIIEPRYGKKQYQPFFEQLYRMSLAGMNIGGGTSVADSGELNAVRYIKDRLGPAKANGRLTVFDVGANVGNYTKMLQEVFKDGADVHSFEPSAKTYKKLSENLAGQKNIHLHNFGLGDKEFRTVLYTNSDESGMASVYKRNLEHFNIEMNKSEEIELRTLDSFCRENNIGHVHFLKLDVEGHELKVIEGAKEMIAAGNIDFIQFEFGGTDIDSRTYFRDFYYALHDKYTINRIVIDGVFPLGPYGEVQESFLTTNFLAEKKTIK